MEAERHLWIPLLRNPFKTILCFKNVFLSTEPFCHHAGLSVLIFSSDCNATALELVHCILHITGFLVCPISSDFEFRPIAKFRMLVTSFFQKYCWNFAELLFSRWVKYSIWMDYNPAVYNTTGFAICVWIQHIHHYQGAFFNYIEKDSTCSPSYALNRLGAGPFFQNMWWNFEGCIMTRSKKECDHFSFFATLTSFRSKQYLTRL